MQDELVTVSINSYRSDQTRPSTGQDVEESGRLCAVSCLNTHALWFHERFFPGRFAVGLAVGGGVTGGSYIPQSSGIYGMRMDQVTL